MKCPECDSEHVVSHTDADLRHDHLLVWQCFDCGEFWITGWDIEMTPDDWEKVNKQLHDPEWLERAREYLNDE